MNPFPKEVQFENAGMINGKRHIITTAPLECVTSLGRFFVPADFITDGGSIPRIAHSLIGHPFDAFLEDCVMHDWLYSPDCQLDFSRGESDHLLRETMWNRRIPKWKIACMWSSVRVGGGRYYRRPRPTIVLPP